MHDTKKQHTLWLLAAASAPLAHFSGCGWFMAVFAALAVLPLILLPKAWDGLPRVVTVLQLLWLGILTGTMLKNSAVYWPSDNDLVVPLTLLALATVTGERAAPRIGAVLAFCMLLLAIPVAVSGAAKMEPDWMRWNAAPWPSMLSLALLLPVLPASGEGKKGKQSIRLGVLSAALALLIQGTISAQVAGAVTDPFYQTARTLGYLEPVAAVGMTLGWYALAIFLLHSADSIAKGCGIGNIVTSVLPVGTAVAAILIKQQPDAWFYTVLSVFLWVLIPFLNKIKKTKKHENSA